ncbi:hypothetical protein [Clostridium tetani]|nr:hypothetical protein [Clostridium tetani]
MYTNNSNSTRWRRYLQGGLSSESPHAEVKEYQQCMQKKLYYVFE